MLRLYNCGPSIWLIKTRYLMNGLVDVLRRSFGFGRRQDLISLLQPIVSRSIMKHLNKARSGNGHYRLDALKIKSPLNSQGACKLIPAASYSPTQSPTQYHRR
jgi:hypothetical protein